MNCIFLRRRYTTDKIPTLSELLSDINGIEVKGVNESNITSYIYIPLASVPSTGLCYIFSICNGYMGIWKIKDGTIVTTPIYQMSSSYGGIHFRTTYGYYYKSGTYSTGSGTANATEIYGGTLALVQFPSYSEEQIDKVLSSISYTRLDGRNNNTTAYVSTNNHNYAFYFGAFSNQLAIYTYSNTFTLFDRVNPNVTVSFSASTSLQTSNTVAGASIIGLS